MLLIGSYCWSHSNANTGFLTAQRWQALPSSSRFSLLIDSYVANMVSCTLRLRCGMPTVLFSKTVSRAFRFICWFYCCNKRGTSSTASVWQISYSPAFVFFPHTVPILWPDLLEELPRVQENIMTERNLMPTEFPLLEEGRQVRGGDPNLITDARYLQDFSFDNDSIGNRAAILWPGQELFLTGWSFPLRINSCHENTEQWIAKGYKIRRDQMKCRYLLTVMLLPRHSSFRECYWLELALPASLSSRSRKHFLGKSDTDPGYIMRQRSGSASGRCQIYHAIYEYSDGPWTTEGHKVWRRW